MSTRRWAAAVALVVLTGCGSGGASDPVAEPDAPEDGVARTVDTDASTSSSTSSSAGDTPSVLDDPAVNPEGVINAAVLLHSDGDVDAALAAGAFTRTELDAARAGLADGSLDYLFE